MRIRVRTVGVVSLTAFFAACASQHAVNPSTTSNAAGVISRSEMEKMRYSSLFDVVQSLRARWLQVRGPTTLLSRPPEVQVVVDDMRMGGVDALRSMQMSNVVSIAFFDPIAAAQRWGGKHTQGTILVTTRADGVP